MFAHQHRRAAAKRVQQHQNTRACMFDDWRRVASNRKIICKCENDSRSRAAKARVRMVLLTWKLHCQQLNALRCSLFFRLGMDIRRRMSRVMHAWIHCTRMHLSSTGRLRRYFNVRLARTRAAARIHAWQELTTRTRIYIAECGQQHLRGVLAWSFAYWRQQVQIHARRDALLMRILYGLVRKTFASFSRRIRAVSTATEWNGRRCRFVMQKAARVWRRTARSLS